VERKALIVAAPKRTKRPAPGADYFELVSAFPLVPIRNHRHLRQAFEMIDRLAIIDEPKLTSGQAEYLLVLSDLIEKYEDTHHRIDLSHVDGVDALAHLLQQNNMSASDLGRLLGNRQLGAAILRRERELSKAHILKLCDRFRVSADLFLRKKPPRRKPRAA
jgi:antitoxin component HigA of HigAB toxin-antitoxin module